MHVRVALIASQGKQVDSLRAQLLARSFRDTVEPSLKGQVRLDREIARDLLAVLAWRNEDPANQAWLSAQEGNDNLVLVDDVRGILGITSHDPADEAKPVWQRR
jgi:hypothetical protein